METIALVVVVLVVVGVVYYLLRGRKIVSVDREKIIQCLRETGGWIELCNVEEEPIFQGRLFTILDDGFGPALGVLMEDRVPTDFIADLKERGEVTYLGKGRILARCLIAFNGNIVLAALEDQEVRDSLQPYLKAKTNIPVSLVLSSGEVSADVDTEAFSQAWEPAAAEIREATRPAVL